MRRIYALTKDIRKSIRSAGFRINILSKRSRRFGLVSRGILKKIFNKSCYKPVKYALHFSDSEEFSMYRQLKTVI